MSLFSTGTPKRITSGIKEVLELYLIKSKIKSKIKLMSKRVYGQVLRMLYLRLLYLGYQNYNMFIKAPSQMIVKTVYAFSYLE